MSMWFEQHGQIPGELALRLLAFRHAQDAERRWPSPRTAEMPEPPWPSTDNPMLEYMTYVGLEVAKLNPEAAIVWVATHAWMEGHVEGYDRAMTEHPSLAPLGVDPEVYQLWAKRAEAEGITVESLIFAAMRERLVAPLYCDAGLCGNCGRSIEMELSPRLMLWPDEEGEEDCRFVHADPKHSVGCRAATFDGDDGWDDSMERKWKAKPTTASS